MSGKWLDIKGPVLADTVYADGQLVAKDVAFTLPAVTPVTSDYKAMGTMTLPTPGQIENMETSITKIGIDLGLRQMLQMRSQTLEFRFVQNVVDSSGNSKQEGCKAFLRAIPMSIPSIGVEVGTTSESELTFSTSRYQLIVGGVEYLLVDRLAQILRIAGQDYANPINNLL